jgi:hypothetical protein
MAGIWDQNAGLEVTSPISAYLENISRGWLNSLLHLPPETEAGFVTGAGVQYGKIKQPCGSVFHPGRQPLKTLIKVPTPSLKLQKKKFFKR